MKRFLAIFATIAIIFAMIYVSPVSAYDKEIPEDIGIKTGWVGSFSCPRIFASGTAVGLVPRYDPDLHFRFQEGYWSQAGSGFVAARGFIFTAAHVLYPVDITLPEGQASSRSTDTIMVTSRTVLIKGFASGMVIGKVAYENRKLDIAVIRYDPNTAEWLTPISGTITYQPHRVEQGDRVVGITHERDSEGELDNNVRIIYGSILQPHPDAPHEQILPYLSPIDLTCWLPILPGDSGSPLFAFDDGKPVLIGIIRAHWYDGYMAYTWAARTAVIWKFVQGRR